jgi:hypothetical protein
MGYLASVTAAQKAYEATEAFQAYLGAKRDWEHAREHAQMNPTDCNRNDESEAFWTMKAKLEAARKTPQHLAAFGW